MTKVDLLFRIAKNIKISFLSEVKDGRFARYDQTEDIVYCPKNIPYYFAHEIGHATGYRKRLNRPSLYKYNSHISPTAVRTEEYVADFIAFALTGIPRDKIRTGQYPRPRPKSRNEYYAQIRAFDALIYILRKDTKEEEWWELPMDRWKEEH